MLCFLRLASLLNQWTNGSFEGWLGCVSLAILPVATRGFWSVKSWKVPTGCSSMAATFLRTALPRSGSKTCVRLWMEEMEEILHQLIYGLSMFIPLLLGFQPSFWWCRISQPSTVWDDMRCKSWSVSDCINKSWPARSIKKPNPGHSIRSRPCYQRLFDPKTLPCRTSKMAPATDGPCQTELGSWSWHRRGF